MSGLFSNMKVGYARVSTKDQNLDLQIESLKKNGAEKIYEEKISGIAKEMPIRNKMLNSLEKGDEVLFWKIDRLGRSLVDSVNFIAKIEEKGANIRSLTETFDSSTPAGRASLGFLMTCAEFEREMNKERTMAGIERAKAKGIKFGRRSKINKEKGVLIKNLVEQGETHQYIANCIGVSRSTIARFLRKTS